MGLFDPVFPATEAGLEFNEGGMLIRDFFAGLVLHAYLSRGGLEEGESYEHYLSGAYAIADHMMAEREMKREES